MLENGMLETMKRRYANNSLTMEQTIEVLKSGASLIHVKDEPGVFVTDSEQKQYQGYPIHRSALAGLHRRKLLVLAQEGQNVKKWRLAQ